MTIPDIRFLIAFAAAASLLSLGGCGSTGTSSTEAEEAMVNAEPPENLRVGIPPQATKVTEGRGTVRYTAPTAGSIYLYDLSGNNTLGQYFVQPGQEFVVSGSAGRATLASNEVQIPNLSASRMYILYFSPAPGSQGDDGQAFRITPIPAQP